MQNKNNFKTVATWEQLNDIDKAFLQEWLIDRTISYAEQNETEDRTWALEWYNANGVALESGKVYEIGFDGRSVDAWWEYRESDEELLEMINEADNYYGSGTFDSVEDFKQFGEYVQTQDYLGVFTA